MTEQSVSGRFASKDLKIANTGGLVFHCTAEEGNEDYWVSFLPGKVVLYGTPGNQIFDINKIDLGSKNTFSTLRDAAELHREGLIDKAYFKRAVDLVLSSANLTEEQHSELMVFIEECDCPPSKVTKKLARMGYERFAAMFVAEKMTEELLKTVSAFSDFVLQAPWAEIKSEI